SLLNSIRSRRLGSMMLVAIKWAVNVARESGLGRSGCRYRWTLCRCLDNRGPQATGFDGLKESARTLSSAPMLNWIWLAFLLIAVLVGGFTGKLPEMTKGAFEMAETAVMKIALPLVGIMAIWLGIMRLAERSGLVQIIARALRPVLRRLFPDVPPEHPAMGAMVMNMAANMLGLGNAATPL